jgi:hypothetical protein
MDTCRAISTHDNAQRCLGSYQVSARSNFGPLRLIRSVAMRMPFLVGKLFESVTRPGRRSMEDKIGPSLFRR